MNICKIHWFCCWKKKDKECVAEHKCVFKKEGSIEQNRKNTKRT